MKKSTMKIAPKVRRRKWMRHGATLVCLLIVGSYLWSRLLSQSRCVRVESRPVQAADSRDGGRLRIACYNIAHGRGLATDNWTGESRQQRVSRLDEIASLLTEIDADIVVLNEVDFQCSWSHGLNQAEYLAQRAGYSYWSEERNLDVRVANLTWRFGNAVLSRYPITDARAVPFPSYQVWEAWLAGKKRGLLCTVDLGEQEVNIVSCHLSHRSEQVRVESARMLCDMSLKSSTPFFLAGDMNSTPTDFPQSSTTTDGENAIAVLDASNLFLRTPMKPPPSEAMTFHSDRPRNTIDWILIPTQCSFLEYEVVNSKLSDHRPVWTDVSMYVATADDGDDTD